MSYLLYGYTVLFGNMYDDSWKTVMFYCMITVILMYYLMYNAVDYDWTVCFSGGGWVQGRAQASPGC